MRQIVALRCGRLYRVLHPQKKWERAGAGGSGEQIGLFSACAEDQEAATGSSAARRKSISAWLGVMSGSAMMWMVTL